MKFSEYPYARPQLLPAEIVTLLERFQASKTAEEQLYLFARLDAHRRHIETLSELCMAKNSQNTRDAFWAAEQAYFDAELPGLQAFYAQVAEKIEQSPFREQFRRFMGSAPYQLALLRAEANRPGIKDMRAKENALISRYQQLIGGGLAEWEGKEVPLSLLYAHKESASAHRRKAAFVSEGNFYAKNAEALHDIFSALVRVRSQMAQKLGFASYVEMGYAEQGRICYGQGEIAGLRRAVLAHMVPLITRLRPRLAALAGQPITFCDNAHTFKQGNPKPLGTPEDIFCAGGEMYRALSPETDAFYRAMRQGELFDVLPRPGKMTGGFCTYLPDFKMPFVFANFTGTTADLQVLTHECGHAFADSIMGANLTCYEQHHNSYDVMEIHSMSMEFFTYPYMHLFFEKPDDYRFAHLLDALKFLPYGCMVDEFQHIVYKQPGLSPRERNQAWKGLEDTYRGLDMAGLPHFADGGGWQCKQHIYVAPFYYIDYVLAQLAAFQFYFRSKQNFAAAWQDYRSLLEGSRTESFLTLIKNAHLQNPLEEKTVAGLAGELEAELTSRLAAYGV